MKRTLTCGSDTVCFLLVRPSQLTRREKETIQRWPDSTDGRVIGLPPLIVLTPPNLVASLQDPQKQDETHAIRACVCVRGESRLSFNRQKVFLLGELIG